MSEELSPEQLALLGYAILRRYKHPDSWQSATTIGARRELYGCMLLKVEEIRQGPGFPVTTITPEQARLNVRAIRLFTAQLKIQPYHMRVSNPEGKAPYLAVPMAHWEYVSLTLAAINAN